MGNKYFGIWAWRPDPKWPHGPGITIRFFGLLFQVQPIKDEAYSERNDPARIRIFGWSIKLFGR